MVSWGEEAKNNSDEDESSCPSVWREAMEEDDEDWVVEESNLEGKNVEAEHRQQPEEASASKSCKIISMGIGAKESSKKFSPVTSVVGNRSHTTNGSEEHQQSSPTPKFENDPELEKNGNHDVGEVRAAAGGFISQELGDQGLKTGNLIKTCMGLNVGSVEELDHFLKNRDGVPNLDMGVGRS
ncbi:hypothetical protein L6452_02506 [Arctium lappa]|uniref:Uncharacterized protein n=1 Tax=Arctium lappa TaxID=4217 RepID=A0ACB9FJ94_ARCLA|nr:hypothetical protein L6452_02506 [Arctium lappa]